MSEVIARVRAEGDIADAWYEKYRDPKPLSEAALRALTLPTGEPPPAELAEWLSYDASWFRLEHSATLRDILRQLFDDMRDGGDMDEAEELEELQEVVGGDVLEYWIKSLPEPIAGVHAIVLPPSGSQEHFLMLEPGRSSLRVLGFHKRTELWWKYESFAAFLAHYFGFEEPE